MVTEMLINTVAGQECRIAIVKDGRLEELYVERASSASHVGNIYKGRVVNIEPSIQAAFVDFGLGKHGFLHISDVRPQFFPSGAGASVENVGRKRPHHKRPPIQDCLQRGQEIVVQMTKEGIGSKGPTMTTYLSLPGKLLVMMPGMNRLGVSRKVEDEEVRAQARAMFNKLKLPPNMGFILRTAGVGRAKRDLQRDLNYLLRLWKTVKRHIDQTEAPAEIYKESDLLIRVIRDVHNKDISRVVCDDERTARRVLEFLRVAMPRTKHRIDVYTGKSGLFHDYGLEEEIEKIYAPRVELPSGGSLVIDQAEALVAIDINTGRFRGSADSETTALKLNQEAAREIARQLRLRDLGGVIVIDFIDMREEKNRRSVERTLRDAMKTDRAKVKILRMSSFGIVEMTRQRVGPSLRENIYRTCSHCGGSGLIKSDESQALQVMRCLQRAAANEDVATIKLTVTIDVAQRLCNHERKQISDLEKASGKMVIINGDSSLAGDEVRIACTNARGKEVAWDHDPLAKPGKREIQTVSLDELETSRAKGAAQPQEKKPRRKGKRDADKQKQTQPAVSASPKPTKAAVKKKKTIAKVKKKDAARPASDDAAATKAKSDDTKKKKRRRGKRGGKKHRKTKKT